MAPAARRRLSSVYTVRRGFFFLVTTARAPRGGAFIVTGPSAASSRAWTWPSRPSISTSSADAEAAPARLHSIVTNTQHAIRMTAMTPMLGSKLRRDVRCNHRPMRLRPHIIVLALVLSLGLLAGCGGGDDKGSEADSSTDATQLLKDTFSGAKEIKSGKLDIKADASSGGQTIAAQLSGPFQSKGAGKVPELDLDATLDA